VKYPSILPLRRGDTESQSRAVFRENPKVYTSVHLRAYLPLEEA
jgi:hypothetical protein